MVLEEKVMYKLNEKQIKRLLQQANEANKRGETLSSVFKKTAEKYSMAQGSVRNIYYKTIKEGNFENLSAKKIVPFDKEEESKLLKRALYERRNYGSMREVFLNMAKGDKKLALRYQNKYCSMIKNKRSMVMREILAQKRVLGECFNPYIDKKNQAEKAKLKNEIDQIIKKITQKCSKENAELKVKLARYEMLNAKSDYEEILESEDNAKKFFIGTENKQNKAKAN